MLPTLVASIIRVVLFLNWYTDIWGPCHITSMSGFWIFLVFVDDYFKMSWVYLLKDRTQVITKIKAHYFSTTIHVLRTNNSLEYI